MNLHSSNHSGPLAVFPSTSSPELDSLLLTLRNNVFIPSHIRKSHRELVFRRKYQHNLTGDDPFSVELDTTESIKSKTRESFILQPLIHEVDEPPFMETIHKILAHLRQSETNTDWEIVPDLLREFYVSKRYIKPPQLEKLVRIAAEKDRMGLIINCIRNADEIGINIGHAGVMREILLGCITRATHADWDLRQLSIAMKQAETVYHLSHNSLHTPVDPKTKPDIVGTVMALVAAKAHLAKAQGQDEGSTELGTDTERIERYATSMLDRSAHADLDLKEGDCNKGNEKLLMWLPVWFGVQMAERVLPTKSAVLKRMKGAFNADIDPLIKKAVAAQQSAPKNTRGKLLYDNLVKVLA